VSALEADASAFRKLLAGLEWQPREWSDEDEICFEWISDERHAIVSIEGDGEIGYAMLVGGRFVAGAEKGIPSCMPSDLASYIAGAAR
jgi:hypothetical protein